jgi:uncharacterized protein YbjT (DUF2867 family)
MNSGQPILLTGASGYIGGRLLRRLESSGHPVRCLTRRPELMQGRVPPPTEVVEGDLLDCASLGAAFEGVEIAYYLVHSMGGRGNYAALDRRAAANFGDIARLAGVRQIVYLGGLGRGDDLSPHLASRHEVGRILRNSRIPTVELRASIVIGSGSASFETVRALVEHLPLIVAPRWVRTLAQPIAVEDVVDYLMAVIELERPANAIYEVGGGDRVTYADVMREYARQRGLHRPVVPMPLITPRSSRLLLGLLTPVYGRVAAAMVESLRNETIVRTPTARVAFAIRPRGLSAAIERALVNEDREFAETRWSDALPQQPPLRWGGLAFGRRLVSSRVMRVCRGPDEAFTPIQHIGGSSGWYAANWFWRLRGLLDTLRGGVGLRRGRRDPRDLRPGDTIDFWRVERFEKGRLMRLVAEMKIPGRLWLQFEVDPTERDSLVRQTTVFDPAGYVGLAYWYLLYPVHRRVFGAMMRGIRREMGPQSATPPEDDQVQGLPVRALDRWRRSRSVSGRWEGGPNAVVHLLPGREVERVSKSGAAQSVQEAEVLLPRLQLERLWRYESLERLSRSYWGFLARIFIGLIRVIHVSDSPTIVLLWRHFPLLHFRAPEYETEESRGRATWWIERGLLVAKRGRGGGFLRLSVERLDREISADTAGVLVRVEVRNFYPWLRGKGRFARFGGWLYSQTQLRIHILVCNAFLRSLTRTELLRPPLG